MMSSAMEGFAVPEKEAVVEGLVKHALTEVGRKYGGNGEDSESSKSYHNRVHTQDVIDASQQIAQLALEAGKISESDIPLIRIAASFHDVEQDLGRGLNEIESARLAEEEMRRAGLFEEEDIQKVREMILATTVRFEDETIRQSATEDYLTQILADADLSNLGREISFYWERALSLLREMNQPGTPSREEEILFTQSQIPLLKNHRFYTPEAEKLYPYKPENGVFAREHITSLVG